MINSLTKEQEEMMKIYADKWISIGTSTEPANRKEAEKGIDIMYNNAGLKIPQKIWCLSPLSAALTRYYILKKHNTGYSVSDSVRDSVRSSVSDSVRDSVMASVRDSVWASVRDSVSDSVWASVRDSVFSSVRDSVGDSVRASVSDSVRASVWASVSDSVSDSVWASVRDSVFSSVRDSVVSSVRDSVWDSVSDSVWASVSDSVSDSVYGQHDAAWLGFYYYFHNVLKLETQTEKLNGLWIYSKNAGWAIPHKNIVFLSERHNVCKLKNGKIHCDGGPAIAYPDGFKIWGLNGVRVPQYLAETPEGKLDVEWYMKEKNADVKAEFVRKFGIERMEKFGTEIDNYKNYSTNEIFKQSEYSLIDFHKLFDGLSYCPHLKMKNQTTETYHIEAVSPECKTIEDAIKFRLKNRISKLEVIK